MSIVETDNQQGWIPYKKRTAEQRLLSADLADKTPVFSEICQRVHVPEKALFPELEIKVNGELLPRCWQQTGSCVGAAASLSYAHAMLGDYHYRQDSETVKLPCPWPTYGEGRSIAGFRSKGSGSFGAAQAQAVERFGMMPIEDERMPKPRRQGNWLIWSSSVEYQWSHPRYWPVPRSELWQEAQKYSIQTITRITSTDEADQLLSQGYGLTIASSFGHRGGRIIDDVLLCKWDGSWAHQMSVGGFWQHPTLGKIYLILNQWGPNSHKKCPTLMKIGSGVDSAFWIEESTFARIIRTGEAIGHSNTKGFPPRDFDWGDLGIR